MSKLSNENLYSLEEYAKIRSEFRSRVMAHKNNRRVHVGPNASLYFEDTMTMQYQIQEMLRAEKIFESEDIEQELSTYNPLIPDGTNWKATFMLEYEDAEERKEALARMIGIEGRTWVQIEGFDKVYAIADEDLERETEEKTSSVHFLRFELDDSMVAAAKSGANILIGIDHENYNHSIDELPANIRDSLAGDLH